MAIAKKIDSIRVNNRIHAKTVRLISVDGRQLGIAGIRDALNAAMEEGLDLVEVAPNSDPPVCRIMDYGKFKYEASKREQSTRKKGKSSQLKEIKLRPHTEDHDLGFKIRSIKKFLAKKDKVKVTVVFRGRELTYKDASVELLKRIEEEVIEEGMVEQPPRQEGRNLTMVIVPK
ncbi:MAG: translation initiation factor IF-3 [Deltaproteobacteria bacterium]|nr:translation initiation factor IF-3 [Deltaproteobacteria bacterium]